jgi:hypothetical protein
MPGAAGHIQKCNDMKQLRMLMREFLIVTIYAAFMLFVMAAIVVFIGLTSPINACESHTDGNDNIVRCP